MGQFGATLKKEEETMQEFDWKNNVDNKEEKLKLAKRMAKRVKDGDVILFRFNV